jgi:hypothetical protein
VVYYLVHSIDIGGPEVMTYRRLLEVYAEEAGLRERVSLAVPVLTPTLSAYWIRFISPVPTSIALPLTEGLTSDAVCRDNRIREIIPQDLISCRSAIRIALRRVKQERLETCWPPAGALLPFEWPYCGDADYAGGTRFVCGYRIAADRSAEHTWPFVSRIGGRYGFFLPVRFGAPGDGSTAGAAGETSPPTDFAQMHCGRRTHRAPGAS